MADHFSQWEWAIWASGSQSSQATAGIQAHLKSGCEACQREQAFWLLLSNTMRAEREPLPQHWSDWTERALAMPQRAAQRAIGVLGVRMIFDSRTAAVAGVRGAGAHRRHCVYELESEAALGMTGTLEVMSEPAGAGRSWHVLGQVLNNSGQGWRDCRIEVAPAACPELTQAANTSGFGEFNFAAVEPGPWRMELQAGQGRWEIRSSF